MKTKFNEGDSVITLVSKKNIKSGTIGNIVEVYSSPKEGYEVEFWDEENDSFSPFAMIVYYPDELEIFNKNNQ